MHRFTLISGLLLLAGMFVLASCGDDKKEVVPVEDAGMDGSADTDTDTDTDSDADGDVGDPCQAGAIQDMVTLEGVCAASESECTAGTSPDSPQGDCASGLTCCLTDDACALGGSGMTTCQDTECEGSIPGFQAGCPDNGWCCVDLGDPDAGPGTQDAGQDCMVSLMMGYLNFGGICQTAGDSCEGGYSPDNEQGNCLASLNLHCCIGTDQCVEEGGGYLECTSGTCTSTLVNMEVGCPSGEICCGP